MCGIVGYVGKENATPILTEGLSRLEYRGYDSAGLAVIRNDTIAVYKAQGKVSQVISTLPARIKGTTGIAHTLSLIHI